MKIVCLIKPRAQTTYFINTLNQRFPLSLVIVEGVAGAHRMDGWIGRLKARIANEGILGMLRQHAAHVAGKWALSAAERDRQRAIAQAFDRILDHRWRTIDPNIRIVEVERIDDDAVRRLLLIERPDVLLDHGTSIVPDDILAAAPLALNLHWGLSPYYRGSLCTKFALLRRDPLNIGVTIHRLSSRVDGGDILGQARPNLESSDQPEMIDAKLSRLGTELLGTILERHSAGVPLEFHAQDTTRGLYTRSRDWTPECEGKLRRMLSSGLQEILLHPHFPPLPIIELTARRPFYGPIGGQPLLS